MKPGLLLLIGALGLTAQSPIGAQQTVPTVGAADLVALISAPNGEHAAQAAQRLLSAAESGNSYAMYDIGTLARQKERGTGGALGYDPGLALKWSLQAFDHGRLTAAYKLALTYRDIGDTLEAMAWAQTYAYFLDRMLRAKVSAKPVTGGKPTRRSDGAVASLMAGLYAELGADQAEAIRLRTVALLREHGPRFESALSRDVDAAHLGDIAEVEGCRLSKRPPRGIWQNGRARESAIIEALIQIDATGRPLQVHLLDFSRKALNAASTTKLVMAYRCPPADASRWTFAIIALDDLRYDVAGD